MERGHTLVRIELGELLDSGKNRIRVRIEPRTITPIGERFTNCATVSSLNMAERGLYIKYIQGAGPVRGRAGPALNG